MSIVVAFFNNKGGVGKTTLACNFAAWLASENDGSVTMVDCDPQANATQLTLSERQWIDIYGDGSPSDYSKSERESILFALSNIQDGDSEIKDGFKLHKSNRFNINVLAGHPSLAAIEDDFSSSWVDFKAGKPGGARRSAWLRQLCARIDSDYIIIDMGPSLGALNRSTLLACDYFVTPVEAGLFSLYALRNIGKWIKSWNNDYIRSRRQFVDTYSHKDWLQYIPDELGVSRGWLGYTIQQYTTKTDEGKLRKTRAYEHYKSRVPQSTIDLSTFSAPSASPAEIGIVPYMFSMIPLAQSRHAPISSLTFQDGLRGGQGNQKERYQADLEGIFSTLLDRIQS